MRHRAPGPSDSAGPRSDPADSVHEATSRLSESGLFTEVENDTTCCYAVQDKMWVHGPGAEPWEVYTVKADATIIHPVGISPMASGGSGNCECGTPTTSECVQLPSCC